MLRHFIKDSALYSVPAILSRGLSLLLIPLYTRVLNPGDYGSLDLFTVFSTIVNLLVALEVSQGLAIYLSSEKNREYKVKYTSTAFWFTLFSYSVFGLIAFGYSKELSNWILGQSELDNIFKIGIIYIIFNGIFYFIQNQLRWELRAQQYVFVSLLMVGVTAGVSILFAYVMNLGLEGLLWGMVAGVFAGVISGIIYLRNSFGIQFDLNYLKQMLFFSVPLVPSGIAVFISAYIDRLMINYFLTIEDVGLYGVAFRLASVVGLLMVGFQGALTPLIYANYQKEETPNELARIFRVFLGLVFLAYLSMALFGKELVMLVTTPQYHDGAKLLIYLVPAILFSQMYIFTPGISISRKTHLTVWINFSGALLNIILNYIFIPILGITGAALATLLSYILVFVAYILFSQRLYYVPHKWLNLILAGLVTVTLAIVVPALNQSYDNVAYLNNWILSLCSLVLLGAVIIGLNIIHLNEIKKAIRIIFR